MPRQENHVHSDEIIGIRVSPLVYAKCTRCGAIKRKDHMDVEDTSTKGEEKYHCRFYRCRFMPVMFPETQAACYYCGAVKQKWHLDYDRHEQDWRCKNNTCSSICAFCLHGIYSHNSHQTNTCDRCEVEIPPFWVWNELAKLHKEIDDYCRAHPNF
jgi:hypothetical protein